jgi:hypothetical protein
MSTILTLPSPQLADHRRWWVLATVAAAQFMLVVDAFIVNVAIPSIRTTLQRTISRTRCGGITPSGLTGEIEGSDGRAFGVMTPVLSQGRVDESHLRARRAKLVAGPNAPWRDPTTEKHRPCHL